MAHDDTRDELLRPDRGVANADDGSERPTLSQLHDRLADLLVRLDRIELQLPAVRTSLSELSDRIEAVEAFVVRAAVESVSDRRASEPGGDVGPGGRDAGDEIVEPEHGHVHGGDERVL
jgi:hypothetical protein